MSQGIQEWTKKKLSSTNFAWSIPEYIDPYYGVRCSAYSEYMGILNTLKVFLYNLFIGGLKYKPSPKNIGFSSIRLYKCFDYDFWPWRMLIVTFNMKDAFADNWISKYRMLSNKKASVLFANSVKL